MSRSQIAAQLLAPLLIALACWTRVGNIAAQEPASIEAVTSTETVELTEEAAPPTVIAASIRLSGIAGVVYKSGGTSPIAWVTVLLYSAADAFIAQTTSAADGTYRFEDLPTGDYKIWAVPPAEFLPAFYDGDPTFATADLVRVPANGELIAVEHSLVRWGTISGAVRQEAVNTPIAFAKIDVWTVDGAWVSSEIADREGGYSVERLPPGSYRVTASAPGYHPAFHVRRVEAGSTTVAIQTVAIQTVVVEEGRTTALTDILLAPEDSAVLTGDASGDGEVTISDFSILAASYGTSEGQVGFFAAADFDGDGSIGIGDFSILAERFGEGTTP